MIMPTIFTRSMFTYMILGREYRAGGTHGAFSVSRASPVWLRIGINESERHCVDLVVKDVSVTFIAVYAKRSESLPRLQGSNGIPNEAT